MLPLAWPRQYWLWGAVALTATVTVLGVILVVVNQLGTSARDSARRPPALPGKTTASHLKSARSRSAGSGRTRDVPKAGLPFVVRTEGQNEREIPVSNLLDAMHTAMGNHGWVELRNREPLHLASDQSFELNTVGLLSIRAAPGIEPVIEFELKGPKPLLATGSGVKLTLSGLTFLVRYPQSGLASASAPPAVIATAGKAKIDRCAFKLVGSSHRKDSCAISSNGGALDVNRSWFQGFDKAIELFALSATATRIEQTMIVCGPGQAQGQLPEHYGWGVQVRSDGSARAQPRLILKHCTVEGAGLIDLSSSRVPTSLQLEVNHCAVRADALIASKPSEPGAPPNAQFAWQGEGNQYELFRGYWIVRSSSQGTTSTAVADPDGWRRVADLDRDPIRGRLKYQNDPAVRKAALRPRDFAIEAPGPPQAKPGADPDQVGPWSNP
jgi:hypothetical protein